MSKQKKIALVAHDNMKDDLLEWIQEHKDKLEKHLLCGTGTTSKIISERLGLDVKGLMSGPMGGDQQIGSRIAEGKIDVLIFFWDPLEAQPHDPDVKALLRIAVLYDIPIANNRASADFILSSHLFNDEYDRHIIDYSQMMKDRITKYSAKNSVKDNKN